MKDGIHPDYHPIKIMMTDGTEYTTRSTWGKAGDTMQLEVDSKSHPAWTGGHAQLLDRGGRLSRFSNKFGGLIKDEGIKVAKGAPQAPSGKPKAPKPEKPKKEKKAKEAKAEEGDAKAEKADAKPEAKAEEKK
jgi:large subunit ribosomal protein L31